MIELLRTRRIEDPKHTLFPFALAIVVAVLGAFVYLELVGLLLEVAS
ncbi:hypothetical protein [Natronorubrum sulfidifaciens]|uniref:Uncharacterized protein n=1 Tax=Natronorubrum sulfidifaciens JCM 14089 TaxID=1230460 RepID=L9WAU9_9EURY|nr:hypothetical protein [Natronorubrum sulfidifaciens]ELY46610.1 hypothetical protein C495_05868 [Natronorubrum sulfidifaciens JCM 14089]